MWLFSLWGPGSWHPTGSAGSAVFWGQQGQRCQGWLERKQAGPSLKHKHSPRPWSREKVAAGMTLERCKYLRPEPHTALVLGPASGPSSAMKKEHTGLCQWGKILFLLPTGRREVRALLKRWCSRQISKVCPSFPPPVDKPWIIPGTCGWWDQRSCD